MEVVIAATKTCHHCPLLEKELRAMEIPYTVKFLEDHPEIVEKHGLKKSPLVIVDGELAFAGMPETGDLRDFLEKRGKQ